MDRWQRSSAAISRELGVDGVTLTVHHRVMSTGGARLTSFEMDSAALTGATSIVIRPNPAGSALGPIPAGAAVTVNGQATTVASSVSFSGATRSLALATALEADAAEGDAVTLGAATWSRRAQVIRRWRGGTATGIPTATFKKAAFVVIWPSDGAMPKPGQGWHCSAGGDEVGLVLDVGERPGAYVLPVGAA